MNRNPNPQGKDLTPVLDSVRAARIRLAVPPKGTKQVSRELFASPFVLHGDLDFKSVPGRGHWLYHEGGCFRLSWITPPERGDARFGRYIGACTLQLDAHAAQNRDLLELSEAKRRACRQGLERAGSLEHALPAFDAALPFCRRVFLSGLAHSLRLSMVKSGMHGLNHRQALAGPTGGGG